jgi:anti-sigma factor ChrR (cupin superfamily)
MRIRADFDLRAVVRPSEARFIPSPMPGVERILLDRIGEEVARATSIVRYAPGSRFSAHVHGGGEEYLVLEGVFSDESGDHPAGTYVRNPIGSRHAPYSDGGCTIFVKLHQFSPDDRRAVVVDTRRAAFVPTRWPGIASLALHAFGSERTELVRFAPGAREPLHVHDGGEECLVLDGEIEDADGRHRAGTWQRSAVGSRHATFSARGCLLWRKTGHLAGLPDGSDDREERTRTAADAP